MAKSVVMPLLQWGLLSNCGSGRSGTPVLVALSCTFIATTHSAASSSLDPGHPSAGIMWRLRNSVTLASVNWVRENLQVTVLEQRQDLSSNCLILFGVQVCSSCSGSSTTGNYQARIKLISVTKTTKRNITFLT